MGMTVVEEQYHKIDAYRRKANVPLVLLTDSSPALRLC